MTRSRRFDYDGFSARYGNRRSGVEPIGWPVELSSITRIGDSVLHDRGNGRPHKGVDIFVPEGTAIRAARAGRVLRVVDGRFSTRESSKRAGLFVDVLATDSRVYRYLHLADAAVQKGAPVGMGALIGHLSGPHTSGLAAEPHLHFEIRDGDYGSERMDYGTPIDPLRLLPPFKVRA